MGGLGGKGRINRELGLGGLLIGLFPLELGERITKLRIINPKD